MRELDLLQHIYQAPAGGRRVLIGPGDDMALVEAAGATGGLLLAVDQVVEGRHFEPGADVRLVGRKAVTRSLSDAAAMASRPLACLAAATLPADFGRERAEGLFDAMRETAASHGCPLVGGDIAIGEPATPLVCSVTILAEPGPAGPVRRSGARAGDALYVTGHLGGSLASGRHLTFEPRIGAAIELAERLGGRLHAMIDVSDGLGADAGHIAERSGVAIEIEAARVPCHDGVGWRSACSDGEDYELCFAAAGEVPPEAADVPVTAVGRVVEAGSGPRVVVRDGAVIVDASALGWEHRS